MEGSGWYFKWLMQSLFWPRYGQHWVNEVRSEPE